MNNIVNGNYLGLMEQSVRWRFLHDLFRNPSEKQWRWIQEEGVWRAGITLLLEQSEAEDVTFLLPEQYSEYEETYISTFEVGAPHPPCPLIESHWNRKDPVPRVLHENILFYKQFGLQLKEDSNETADHLRHQTEFISYLYAYEAELSVKGEPDSRIEQIRQGREEYIQRHWLSWTPKMARSIQETLPNSWPASWMNLILSITNK